MNYIISKNFSSKLQKAHSECANTIGNYTCQCNDGYILVEDKCEENLECPARNKCDAAAHGCRLEKGVQICYCNVCKI